MNMNKLINRKNESGNTFVAVLIGLAVAIPFVVCLLVYGYWAWGLCLMNLWNWFLAPLVGKSLTLLHAIGVVITVSLLTKQPANLYVWFKEQEEDIPLGKKALYYFSLVLIPWTALFFGWVVKSMMG